MTYIGPVGQSKLQQSVYITPASTNLAAEVANIPGFTAPQGTQNGYYTFGVATSQSFVMPAGHFVLNVSSIGASGSVAVQVANGPAGPGDFSSNSTLFSTTSPGVSFSFSSDGINLRVSISASANMTISYIV